MSDRVSSVLPRHIAQAPLLSEAGYPRRQKKIERREVIINGHSPKSMNCFMESGDGWKREYLSNIFPMSLSSRVVIFMSP